MALTNDQKATITGAIIALGGAVAIFFPQVGPLIQQIAQVVALVAIAFLGYLTNKGAV